VTCQDVVGLVTAYLEDALRVEDRAAFEDHLLVCDGCVRYLQQMRRTIDLVGKVGAESLSPQTRQGLLEAFADWKRSAT